MSQDRCCPPCSIAAVAPHVAEAKLSSRVGDSDGGEIAGGNCFRNILDGKMVLLAASIMLPSSENEPGGAVVPAHMHDENKAATPCRRGRIRCCVTHGVFAAAAASLPQRKHSFTRSFSPRFALPSSDPFLPYRPHSVDARLSRVTAVLDTLFLRHDFPVFCELATYHLSMSYMLPRSSFVGPNIAQCSAHTYLGRDGNERDGQAKTRWPGLNICLGEQGGTQRKSRRGGSTHTLCHKQQRYVSETSSFGSFEDVRTERHKRRSAPGRYRRHQLLENNRKRTVRAHSPPPLVAATCFEPTHISLF